MITPYPMYPQQYQYPVQMPTQNNAYPTQMNVAPTQQNVNSNVGTPQIQNGGFVSIPDENMVNTYPVLPGNCVTFKVEGKPIVMEKSMGFSQLESPKIERYRLVKEETEKEPEKEETVQNVSNDEIDHLNDEIDRLNDKIEHLESEISKTRGDVDALKPKKTTTKRNGED